MKRLLLLALCALFAADAGARTLYVDARRPNNNGSGLSRAKAKKTIQAAINVAKKGDTILVLPGTYAPIKTNNKKIAIKSVKGQKKTTVRGQLEWNWNRCIVGASAQLGRVIRQDRYVMTWDGEYPNRVYGLFNFEQLVSQGTKTQLRGFRVKGLPDADDPLFASFYCVVGGTVSNCLLEGTGTTKLVASWQQAAWNSKLAGCTVRNLYCMTGGPLFEGCTLQRCKVQNNNYDFAAGPTGYEPMVVSSKFFNCLFAGNARSGKGAPSSVFTNSVLVNCTVADNTVRTSVSGERLAAKSKFYNCILRNNSSQRTWTEWDDETGEEATFTESERLQNVASGNVFKNTDTTNRDPKLTSAYKLKKGSYCINSGKLTKKQKKLVGTKDLAGKKRIKGKAIDRGCYEY